MTVHAYANLVAALEAVKPASASCDCKQHEYNQVNAIVKAIREYLSEIESYVADCPGLKVISDFDIPRRDVVGKNLSWLTSVAVARQEPIRLTIDIGDPEKYSELNPKVNRLKSSLLSFDDYSKHGIVIPAPVVNAYADMGISRSTHCLKINDDVFNVGFSNGYLRQQFTEQGLHPYPPGVIEFLLPNVANVPLSEIIALRKDSNDLFTSFQNVVTNFARNSSMAADEGKILDLLAHIDEQVRRLCREFEKLDKRKSLEKKGLAYSFGVLSLVLFVPPEILRSLLVFLGTSGLYKSLQNIRLIQFEERELKNDPFYIPYKLAKLSGQMKQSSKL